MQPPCPTKQSTKEQTMDKANWPPKSAEDMSALQEQYGSDVNIAEAVNLTPSAITCARQKLGVPVYSRHNFWSEGRIAQITKLWAQGLSANAIAEQMGCTRNAVVGKAHRLELAARPNPIKPRSNGEPSDRTVARRRQVARDTALQTSESKQTHAEMVEHTSRQRPMQTFGPVTSCQWIEGEARARDFCGDRTLPGKSYCQPHYARAYLPPKVKAA